MRVRSHQEAAALPMPAHQPRERWGFTSPFPFSAFLLPQRAPRVGTDVPARCAWPWAQPCPGPAHSPEKTRGERAESERAWRKRTVSVHGACTESERASVHGERACTESARGEHAQSEHAWSVWVESTHGESTHRESARSERGWSEHAQRACTERGCTARAHLLAALAGVQSLPRQRGIRELPPRRPQPSQLSGGFPCYTSGEAALTRSHAKGTYAHTGVGGRIELRTRPRTSCARRSPSGRPPRAAGEQTETQARCGAALDAEEAMRDSARAPRSGGSGCL